MIEQSLLQLNGETYPILRKSGWQENKIRKVTDHVYANLSRPILLDELAEESAYSSRHLQTVFKKQTGQRLGQYIIDQRLFKALRLLKSYPISKRTILDVAIEVGYDSHSAFSRAFRNRFMVSPSQISSDTLVNDLHVNQSISSQTPYFFQEKPNWTSIGFYGKGFDGYIYPQRDVILGHLTALLVKAGYSLNRIKWFFCEFNDVRQEPWEQCQFFLGFLIDPQDRHLSIFQDLQFYQYQGGKYLCMEHLGNEKSVWRTIQQAYQISKCSGIHRPAHSCLTMEQSNEGWQLLVNIPITNPSQQIDGQIWNEENQ